MASSTAAAGPPRRLPARVWLLSVPLAVLIGHGLRAAWPDPAHPWDFGAFWLAGQAAARRLDPYSVEALKVLSGTFEVEYTRVNLNPPVSLLFFEPLSAFDAGAGMVVWWVASFLSYAVSMAVLLRSAPRPRTLLLCWSLATTALWATLALGQVYAFLLLPLVIAPRLPRRWSLLGQALAIGLLIAFKPQYGLWPCLLLAAGHLRLGAGALLAGLLATLASVLVHGVDALRAWLAVVRAHSDAALSLNASVTHLVGDFLGWGVAGLLGVGSVLGVLGWALRTRPGATRCADLGLTLATALSPVAWAGYTLLLLPVLARRRWSPPLMIAAGLLAAPADILFLITRDAPRHPLRLVYPLALVLILWALRSEERPEESA